MDADKFAAYAESLSKPDLVRSLVQAKEAFDVATDLLDVLSSEDSTGSERAQARAKARQVVAAYLKAEEEAETHG